MSHRTARCSCVSVLVLALGVLALHGSVLAQGGAPAIPACQPGWLPTFGAEPGVNDKIQADVVFDPGNGPELFVGGSFTTAGGLSTSYVARWNGTEWSPLLNGPGGPVRALAVFDDGTGPALYAGGDFTTAGGMPANHLARWDGTNWSALGGGVEGDHVSVLTAFDDGSGPALFVGGTFTLAGGMPVNGIAKWDGANWSGVGTSSVSFFSVTSIAVADLGGGRALYVGGYALLDGGVDLHNVAKWDGTSWSTLGAGLTESVPVVHSLAAYDDGSGTKLFVSGDFEAAGGMPTQHFATWNGSSWTAYPASGVGVIDDFTVFDDGSGPALYGGGSFALGGSAGHVAHWNGASWTLLASDVTGAVKRLAAYDAGTGESLFALGALTEAGVTAVSNIARWDGANWSALDHGLDAGILALTTYDDGSGAKLVAGGKFTAAGGKLVSRIATWDGTEWSALGAGMNGDVQALVSFDDGIRPALYAGGFFSTAGGLGVNGIAKWDGAAWSPLGSGFGGNSQVYALAVFDDGNGPALYAGGTFLVAGGVTVNRIAKWNGSQWSALNNGMSLAQSRVTALQVFDDGSGPALYVGGFFSTAGGVTVNHVARWDGTSFADLDGGTNGTVEALAVFDDGSGPALHALGSFTLAGGVPVNHIAKWNGTGWSALGSGLQGNFLQMYRSLATFDDGTGPALLATGYFDSAGGAPAASIAKWNGVSWSALGSGLLAYSQVVHVFDDGTGPALFVGGTFPSVPDSGDSYLAKWGGCPALGWPWTDLGLALDGASGPPQLAGSGSLIAGGPVTIALTNAAPSAPALLFISLTSSPVPFKCGTLVPVPWVGTLSLTTNGVGAIPLAWSAWPSGLSGLSLYWQYSVKDAAAICGASLSNALRADVP